jgi:hypothetical protein
VRAGKKLKRSQRLEIESAGYRQTNPRLIGPERELEVRPVVPIDLIFEQATAGQDALSVGDDPVLHRHRRGLVWSSGERALA